MENIVQEHPHRVKAKAHLAQQLVSVVSKNRWNNKEQRKHMVILLTNTFTGFSNLWLRDLTSTTKKPLKSERSSLKC